MRLRYLVSFLMFGVLTHSAADLLAAECNAITIGGSIMCGAYNVGKNVVGRGQRTDKRMDRSDQRLDAIEPRLREIDESQQRVLKKLQQNNNSQDQ